MYAFRQINLAHVQKRILHFYLAWIEDKKGLSGREKNEIRNFHKFSRNS